MRKWMATVEVLAHDASTHVEVMALIEEALDLLMLERENAARQQYTEQPAPMKWGRITVKGA